MPDYKSMYYHLAGKVATAIELLTKAQLEGEEQALEEDKPALSLKPQKEKDRD